MQVDVAIVGGGLVGASLAIALGQASKSPGKSVALIEAAPPRSEPAWDERTIALNLASRRIYSNLGLWPVLAPDTSTIVATHISERGRFGVARFTAEEAGEEALGWNIPVRALGAALWTGAQAARNVQLICPASVEGIEAGDEFVTLRLDSRSALRECRRPDSNGAGRVRGNDSELRARLVVAADGAQSVIRRELGIGAEELDYGQVASPTSASCRKARSR